MSTSSPAPVVGIDLGTTYSVMAYLDAQGRPTTVPNAEGDITTPSTVFLDPAGAVVGKEAVRAAEFEPERVARHPKRSMGQKHFPQLVRSESWPPEVLQASILRKLKQDAEQKLGPVSRAVITVPAYFNEPRRKATQDAGRMAGWDVLDILNEPTAAAIAFGMQAGFVSPTAVNEAPETVLVYDLGGGTFDVTVMRVERNCFTVLATAGDVTLGGLDWDNRIIDHVANQCLKEHHADPRTDAGLLERLRGEAEAAKRSLSARPSANIAFAWDSRRVKVPLAREQFEEMTGDLLERTRLTVRRLIKDAGIAYKDITRILLAGGSTRMPMVAAMLQEETSRPPDRSLAPDEAVAHGAAVYANSLAGRFGKGGLHITNVNAHDLGVMGVEKSTGMPRRHVMIRRNTALPSESTTRFQTQKNAKASGAIRIVEGGDDSGNGSTAIGSCVVRDLPTGDAADRTITVTFHYATNGCLEVTAHTGTGKAAKTIVERAAGMPEVELVRWTERVANGLVPIGVLDDDDEVETELEPIEDDPLPEASAATEEEEEIPLDEIPPTAAEESSNPFNFKG